MLRLLNIFKNKQVGLVLGSGGSKGIAHIAVIEYLEALGIQVRMISGASIGAVIGAVYAAGSLPQLKKDLQRMQRREMMSYFDIVFPKSGLLEGKKVVEFLKKYISEKATFDDLRIPLGVVATDLYNGQPVVLKSGRVLDAVRASISIPGVFVPVSYNETLLVDGGVANPLPIDVVRGMGAGITIAVNLHPTVQTKIIRKKITALDSVEIKPQLLEIAKSGDTIDGSFVYDRTQGRKWLQSVERWLGVGDRTKQEKTFPNIFEIISQTIDIMGYMNTMMMLKYNAPTVLIEPNLVDLPTLDFLQVQHALDEGERACERMKHELIKKVKKRS